MRAVYETEWQRKTARLVIEALGMQAIEHEKLSHQDFDVNWKGKILTAEVKVRSKRYGTEYMIAKSKFDHLLEKQYGVLIIAWQDIKQVGLLSVKKLHEVRFARGGRTDRNDAADLEMCAFIPYDKFTFMPVNPALWVKLQTNEQWLSEYSNTPTFDKGD